MTTARVAHPIESEPAVFGEPCLRSPEIVSSYPIHSQRAP